ncbi:MAG: AMP-binding protein, partial [Chloroflexota bacterium]
MDRPWFQFYDEGIPRTLDLSVPDITVPDFLSSTAQQHPKQIATVFMGARLNYQRLHQKVKRLAGALHALGIQKGDRVGIILPNCPQMVISYYAVLS